MDVTVHRYYFTDQETQYAIESRATTAAPAIANMTIMAAIVCLAIAAARLMMGRGGGFGIFELLMWLAVVGCCASLIRYDGNWERALENAWGSTFERKLITGT